MDAATIAADPLAPSYSSHLHLAGSPRPVPRRPGAAFPSHRRRRTVSNVRCRSGERGLQPKPTHRPPRLPVHPAADSGARDSYTSGKIENLVFFGRYEEALELFDAIGGDHRLGVSTYDALVNACVGLRSVRGVKRVYKHVLESGFELDQYMRNRFLLMPVKCGMMVDARLRFDEMPERNLVSWNTIIGGLVGSAHCEEALDLFFVMWEELSEVGSRTFATAIRAASGIGLVEVGRQLHCLVVKMGTDDNIYVLYWNALIAGYGNHGQGDETINMFNQMVDRGMIPNHVTFLAVLSACSYAGLIDEGWEIFESISEDYNVKPRAMHYARMIELLGR